jgi:hypothetical protein
MSSKKSWAMLALACGLLWLSGCATVNEKHPQLMLGEVTAKNADQVASVYFIRPKPYKTKGVANDPVRIEYQGKLLLKMDEGSYTLLHIKPSKGLVKVFSKTMFTNDKLPIEVWRARHYKFIPGKTYFIYIHQINEEFRGVFYDPEPVSLREAKTLLETTRAAGAARNAPIDKLTEVEAPPASALEGQEPALPENIYKQEKYLHKVQ